MIGELPTTLNIGGKDIPIRSDYRTALVVIQAMNDPDLNNQEKSFIMLDALIGIRNIPDGAYREAIEKSTWFLNGGKDNDEKKRAVPQLIDWQKDEQMIFSSINHIAGKELRAEPYCHWWTFLGYFNEIQEGLFSTVLEIRSKRSRGKKLDQWEKDYYSRNKDLIDIRKPESEEEKKYRDALNEKFK